ncbi:MAG TPA: DUF1002 domain-containing protein [Epulopiscium sp.]|nr:DUF1002 domain-containing protein [Candidatus Epulonipiscium sp.]
MRKHKLKTSIVMILTIILSLNTAVYADTSAVVTLGKDLTKDQKKQMIQVFGVDQDDVTLIEVNNEEERKYLEGVASEGQLGTRTISSAYVELLDEGSGISVETHNISWVTKSMYESALITAGVKDAKIIAAAPFPVSGTGALTGILKAFEVATGKKISEEQKKVANEEVFQTGELGDAIGQDEAGELMRKVKEMVISQDIKDAEGIKQAIIQIAGDLNINLNADQTENMAKLMEKINGLNLDKEQITSQLKDIGKKLDNVIKNNEEVRTLLQKILDAIKEFFSSFFSKK